MHSAKLTTVKIFLILFVTCGLHINALAQENSPYSRYGFGDLTPNHSSVTRGMGGIAAGVADNRSINSTNPASLTSIFNTVLDVSTEIDYRTLKSTNPAKKFTSANTYVSYLQLAFPLSTPKMIKKRMFWAMSFGLKPIAKTNYKIQTNLRDPGIDSISTLQEGSGGLNQAFLGTGIRFKNLSIGFNGGYMFGSKDNSSQRRIVNDTVFYAVSNSGNKVTYGGLFINAGLQYDIVLKRDKKNDIEKFLRLGVYGNMKQNLKATNDKVSETIVFDQNGNQVRVDSVYAEKVKGTITYPAMVGVGFTYQDLHWLAGADFEYGNWASFRYFGNKDDVQNNWLVRAGVQYYPAKDNTPVKKYFNFVKYRAGLYYGSDYIKANGTKPEYGFTVGTGMPLTSLRKISYTGEYVVLNTGLEFGSRGNKQTNLRESIFRFNIGISLNARWFQKPKYN